MNRHFLFYILLSVISLNIIIACSTDIGIDEEENGNLTESPESYHDKTREYPYPKHDNEIYLNPPPLIVPQAMNTTGQIQFTLSADEHFRDNSTLISDVVSWNMYNPHRTLQPGIWYWRFRSIADDGTVGEWSSTYHFKVKEETPGFVTPKFSAFFNNIPQGHPRLFSFLDPYIDSARRKVTEHREYKALIGRAELAMKYDYKSNATLYDFTSTEAIKMHIDHLYQAYYLTENETYRTKMLEVLRYMLNAPASDAQLFASNFGATNIAAIHLQIYDIAFELLTSEERTATEELMLRVARFYYRIYCGMQENTFFDNHFWQHNMRVFFQIAFMLFDKYSYAHEATQMLEYYYELWTARAPDAGYNRSGLWKNGAGYLMANVKTLYYMPSLLSAVTSTDFLQHPWYQNAGRALVYTWPPKSATISFGDANGTENSTQPDRQRIAFADFLARETGDSYAVWYAKECEQTLINDLDLRLYRMVNPKSYSYLPLPQSPKLLWHEDAGEVSIHSNLSDVDNNLSLGFRSSTFGTNSHTIADQNSFTLLYRGHPVFCNGGYYVGAQNTAYNLLWYRHTRNHNSILVNGIGQSYSLQAYGHVLRALGGQHIGYCVGDASNAYNGISEEKLWVDNFRNAGIEQTPENGFGETPLKKYVRHLVVLYPDIVLIYDDLKADELVRWDWLLHSPTKFNIQPNSRMLSTNNTERGFSTHVHQFGNADPLYTQTTETTVPLTSSPDPRYPDFWHLTAAFHSTPALRLLTVVQVTPDNKSIIPIHRIGNKFTIGNWNIDVEMDVDSPANIHITHQELPVTFDSGAGDLSVLFDETETGEFKTIKMGNRNPISTRLEI